MNDTNFKIGIKTMWILTITGILSLLLGALAHIEGWEIGNLLLILGVGLSFTTWIITASDVAQSPIRDKTFWILVLVSFPTIACLFYLVKKNKVTQTLVASDTDFV